MTSDGVWRPSEEPFNRSAERVGDLGQLKGIELTLAEFDPGDRCSGEPEPVSEVTLGETRPFAGSRHPGSNFGPATEARMHHSKSFPGGAVSAHIQRTAGAGMCNDWHQERCVWEGRGGAHDGAGRSSGVYVAWRGSAQLTRVLVCQDLTCPYAPVRPQRTRDRTASGRRAGRPRKDRRTKP